MDTLKEALRHFDALRNTDQIHEAILDRVKPVYSDEAIFDELTPKVSYALRAMGINRLYEHQTEAIMSSLQGNDVVLEAPTASGKTLSFAIPMVEGLLRSSGGHGLMIYPMNAVAHDQRDQLVPLFDQVGIQSWTYDGSTDKEHRSFIRMSPPDVLITNPEMLNLTFLGWNEQWSTFLKSLKFVVIDEMHEYRGYFGSNMSLLLRRFFHHLHNIGASPQIFLATATCANPIEHARNLTGKDSVLINATGKVAPKRHFIFIEPNIADFQFYRIFQVRIRNAALACMKDNKSVIVFCPTIRFAEWCYNSILNELDNLLKEEVDKLDADEEFFEKSSLLSDGFQKIKDSIALFKRGITSEQKSAIQKGMKEGSINIVFSTSALELGIDVGGLDGVILAGFPDTVMSAWQRIGRAGRAWDKDAFVLFYAMNNPVDRFHASNLKTFLEKPLDEIVADPSNEELIQNHLPSLLYESSGVIKDDSEDILGQSMYVEARDAAKGFRPIPGNFYKPQGHLNLRGVGGTTWILKHNTEEVGSIADYQRFREAYPGAILLHSGRKYKVDSVTEGSTNEISLTTPEVEYIVTKPFFIRNLNIEEIFDGFNWHVDNISTYLGKVSLYEGLNNISIVDDRNDQVLNRYTLEGHAKSSISHAFWIDLNLVANLEIEDESLYAFEQLLRVGTIFNIPADTHDTTTHTDKQYKQVFLIENYPGGIGIVKKAFTQWHNILKTGISVAQTCNCSRGCPNCIIPPRYYGDDNSLDKQKGIELAEYVIANTPNSPDAKFDVGLWKDL